MRTRRRSPSPPAGGAPAALKTPSSRGRRWGGLALFAIFAGYLGALVYAHGRFPPALNNDAAEEALRGIYLVESRHFEVLTFAVGNSAETLYLYLVGAVARLFGTTELAIQLPSWILAVVCIWLVVKLVERVDSATPRWLPALLGACSIWLFHYACCGLRAISAPVFLALFALLLDRLESHGGRAAALGCGAVLGLSLYAYTSARALPVAFVIYAAFRLYRHWKDRAVLIRRYGLLVAGAALASLPNLFFFLREPKAFLFRGSYVWNWGTDAERFTNLLWSILFPAYYPAFYRHSRTTGYDFDGVSAGLGAAGLSPVHWIFAIALVIGLLQVRRMIGKPIVDFLLAAWLAMVLALGPAGPSLTRFLILLPVYLVFAALGVRAVTARWPRLAIPAAALILWAGIGDGYRYASAASRAAPEYKIYFNTAATNVGEEARALAAQGRRVICILAKDANVARYLTHDKSAVKVLEFYDRPLAGAEIPFAAFHPDALLVENTPAFLAFAEGFPPEWRRESNGDYLYIRLPAAYGR